MRRVLAFLLAALSASLIIPAFLASPASAQTSASPAFCAGRLQLNPSSSKAEAEAAFDLLATTATGAAVDPATALKAMFAKKGMKTFENEAAFARLGELDAYVYENCPGNKLPVTAIDYEFQGIPDALPAGVTQIKFTNNAPKEEHELIVAPLLPAGESEDLEKLLAMPDKKVAKYVDVDRADFIFARPGESSHTVTELEPGKYIYACFIPVGGKESGKPHFMQGMYGTFTVS